jgi:hypothetical protein
MLMAKVVGLRKPSSQNTHGGEDFRNTCKVLQYVSILTINVPVLQMWWDIMKSILENH